MICLFMVMQKSMTKYITRMGQNTGTLNASKKVQTMATRMPLVAACLKRRRGQLGDSGTALPPRTAHGLGAVLRVRYECRTTQTAAACGAQQRGEDADTQSARPRVCSRAGRLEDTAG